MQKGIKQIIAMKKRIRGIVKSNERKKFLRLMEKRHERKNPYRR